MTEARSPSPRDIRRWRRYLADERAEAEVYRELAARSEGEDREILLGLAEAERRHEQHWLDLLGDRAGAPVRGDLRTRMLVQLARRFRGVFVLALAQRAEARSPYGGDRDATARMAADELIHEEVMRSLAGRGRLKLSGNFRAAVFGANDGLVSNLALVLGMIGAAAPTATVLLAGVAGLLAGSLSMAAGEYVSVRSQRELLRASRPDPRARDAVHALDVDANELALVYRARGESEEAARGHADRVLRGIADIAAETGDDQHEAVGSAAAAAASSFCFFASGALVPVVPFLLGLSGAPAVLLASLLVGIALLATGATVGVLSGASPIRRALRQLAIGFGAAGVTYVIGALFGATV